MHEGFEDEIKGQPKTHQDTHQDKILEFCREPRTTKEIMAFLELKDRRNFYLKYMRPLLDSGKLQMTIPDKPNTKNQKYITKQGKVNMRRIAITTGGVKQSLSNSILENKNNRDSWKKQCWKINIFCFAQYAEWNKAYKENISKGKVEKWILKMKNL